MKYPQHLSGALLIALLRIPTAESSIRGGINSVEDDRTNNSNDDRSHLSQILRIFRTQSRRRVKDNKEDDYDSVFDQEYEKRNANLDPALLYYPKFLPVFQLDPPTQSPAPSTQGPTIASTPVPSAAATSPPTSFLTPATTPFPTSTTFGTPSPTTSIIATSAPVLPTISPKPTLTNSPTSFGIPTVPPLVTTSSPTIRGTFASFTTSPGFVDGTAIPTLGGTGTPAPSTGFSFTTSAPTFPSISAATLSPTVGGSSTGSMNLVRTPAPTVFLVSSLSPMLTAAPSIVGSSDAKLSTISTVPVSSLSPTLPSSASLTGSTSDEPTIDDASSLVPSQTAVPTFGSSTAAEERSGILTFESFLLGGTSDSDEMIMMKNEEFWSTLFVRDEDSLDSP